MSINISFTSKCNCVSGRQGTRNHRFYEADEGTLCYYCNGTGKQLTELAEEFIEAIANHPHELRRALGLQTPMDKVIDRSWFLTKLEEGWDDENAKPIAYSTRRRAISFLRYVEYRELEIPPPDIVPVCDGSVDLEWRGETYHVLINFDEDEKKDPTYSWGMGKDADEVNDSGHVRWNIEQVLKPLIRKDEA
jgi:hypothetical protein